jgi:hypothetical protein
MTIFLLVLLLFQMGDTMKLGMKRTLVDWYGDDHSQVVTDAWDLAQSRVSLGPLPTLLKSFALSTKRYPYVGFWSL